MNQTYYNELNNIPTLTKKEQLALIIKAKAGDNKAREQLINTNLKLVVHYAKKFNKYLPNDGALTEDDLICEGNIALIKAVEEYIPDSGTTFSYFAGVVIKRKIISFIISNNGNIKLPQRKMKELLKQAKNAASNEIEQSAGGEYIVPTKVQLPEYFEFRANENDDENTSEMWESIELALKSLKPREREIIEYYHQLNGEKKTHTQMAEMYGISNIRVGQIYKRGIEKIYKATNQQAMNIIF